MGSIASIPSIASMHPVDVYERVHEMQQAQLAAVARSANEFVNTEEYASGAAQFANAFFGWEFFRKEMTGMPVVSMEMFSSAMEEINKAFITWSALWTDSLKGDFQKTAERGMKFDALIHRKYDIGRSPKELVWQSGIVKLWRYHSENREKHLPPLLLVFAVMNTPWIFDLYPENSFVAYMLERGHDVFLIEWGSPTTKESHWSFDTYVLGFLPQLTRVVKELSGSRTFNMLGWCLGSLMSSLYAALRPDSGLRNLVLLTPPLDFTPNERLTFGRWAEEINVDTIIAANGGIMPAWAIQTAAKMLKPIENGPLGLLKLFDRIEDPRFVEGWSAMNTWVGMSIPMAGAFWKDLIKDLYRGNKLTRGEFRVSGELADLGAIRANVLAIVAASDHITPPIQTENAFPLIGGAHKELVTVPGGHIGAMAGSGAKKFTWPMIDKWCQG